MIKEMKTTTEGKKRVLSNLANLMRMRKSLIITLLLTFPGPTQIFAQQPSITEYLAECERKYGSRKIPHSQHLALYLGTC